MRSLHGLNPSTSSIQLSVASNRKQSQNESVLRSNSDQVLPSVFTFLKRKKRSNVVSSKPYGDIFLTKRDYLTTRRQLSRDSMSSALHSDCAKISLEVDMLKMRRLTQLPRLLQHSVENVHTETASRPRGRVSNIAGVLVYTRSDQQSINQ